MSAELGDDVAILIAAGLSERMRQPKALLNWDGRSLVQYQIEALQRTGVAQIVVVLGYGAHEIGPVAEAVSEAGRTSVVTNPEPERGKTSSIRCGLRALHEPVRSVLILAVDQPRPPELLQHLLDEHLRRTSVITLPVHAGRRGHPPVFSGRLVPDLRRLREETHGLREVLRRYADDVEEVEWHSSLVRTNLNTPEEYTSACREFSKSVGDDSGRQRR